MNPSRGQCCSTATSDNCEDGNKSSSDGPGDGDEADLTTGEGVGIFFALLMVGYCCYASNKNKQGGEFAAASSEPILVEDPEPPAPSGSSATEVTTGSSESTFRRYWRYLRYARLLTGDPTAFAEEAAVETAVDAGQLHARIQDLQAECDAWRAEAERLEARALRRA